MLKVFTFFGSSTFPVHMEWSFFEKQAVNMVFKFTAELQTHRLEINQTNEILRYWEWINLESVFVALWLVFSKMRF